MINKFRTYSFCAIFAIAMVSCVAEDDYATPPVGTAVLTENFQAITNNTNLDLTNWTNFAEAGTSLWREKTYTSGGVTNGYAEFSAYNSGNATNTVWLVSPALDGNAYAKKGVSFKVAQHHLDIDTPSNSLQVLVATNYDGTNVKAANWTVLPANIPTMNIDWYEFISSNINLSAYKGTIHIAFKFTGSGTNTALDGAFQVDDFVYYNQDN